MEAEDFPGALNYLKWVADPLLAQILVLRLRLLAARHAKQRHAILDRLEADYQVRVEITEQPRFSRDHYELTHELR